MFRIAAVFIVAAGVAACGMVDALKDGWKHTQAVEADLEQSTGVRPQVGFNWKNGRLTQVTVQFPQLYEAKPLHDLAASVRRAVTAEFQQTPDNIVLAFSLGKSDAGTVTRSRDTRQATSEKRRVEAVAHLLTRTIDPQRPTIH